MDLSLLNNRQTYWFGRVCVHHNLWFMSKDIPQSVSWQNDCFRNVDRHAYCNFELLQCWHKNGSKRTPDCRVIDICRTCSHKKKAIVGARLIHTYQHSCPHWYSQSLETKLLCTLYRFLCYPGLDLFCLTNQLGGPCCPCLSQIIFLAPASEFWQPLPHLRRVLLCAPIAQDIP